MRKRLGEILKYYSIAHVKRAEWYSWKWRLFCILLALFAIAFVNDYLQTKYLGYEIRNLQEGVFVTTTLSLADKLFYWFMTGFLFGVIALAILYEGEFILGLRKIVREFEKEFGSEAKRITKIVSKTVGKTAGAKPKRK